jgi:hypothetical protein
LARKADSAFDARFESRNHLFWASKHDKQANPTSDPQPNAKSPPWSCQSEWTKVKKSSNSRGNRPDTTCKPLHFPTANPNNRRRADLAAKKNPG